MQPIIVADGKIVDGRHRYMACLEVGIDPKFDDWTGCSRENLLRLVTANNLTRRHETDAQRAMTAAELAKMGLGTKTELAACMKVKARLLNRTVRVLKNGSDNVVDMVSSNRMSLHAAEQAVTGSVRAKPAKPRCNRLVARFAKSLLDLEKCLERGGEIADKWHGSPDVNAKMLATANRLTKLVMTFQEDGNTHSAE